MYKSHSRGITEGQNFCSSKRNKTAMSELQTSPMNIFTQWYERRGARRDKVSTEIMLQILRSRYQGHMLVRGTNFLISAMQRPDGPPCLLSNKNLVLFSQGFASYCLKLFSHFWPVPRFRIYTSAPWVHDFMAWCSTGQMHITFYMTKIQNMYDFILLLLRKRDLHSSEMLCSGYW